MGFQAKNILDKVMIILRGIGLIFLYMVISPLFIALLSSTPLNKGFIGKNLVYILAEALVLLILIIIFNKRITKDWKDFKKNYKKYLKQGLICWFIGFIIMFMSNIIINMIIVDGGMAANESANREVLNQFPIYSILAMCIMAPVCEELLFRASFKNGFSKAITFCLFTGILFAGMHVATGIESWSISYLIKNWQQLLYFIPYSSVGIAFGYVFYKTDNIFSSISMHMFHNSLSVAFILLAMLSGGA